MHTSRTDVRGSNRVRIAARPSVQRLHMCMFRQPVWVACGVAHRTPPRLKSVEPVACVKCPPCTLICFCFVGKALVDAREAYLKCIALNGLSGDDLQVQAQVGLARLEFVVGDPASTRFALARLSEVMRDHPYSNSIEDVIYLLAIQSRGQTGAAAMGALEYLDYLRESYAPAYEGAPTGCLYPRWDSNEEDVGERRQNGDLVGAAEYWRGEGLQVRGLPAWALQFQIGLLASRMENSTRAMETMENAFTSYEAWLPRCTTTACCFFGGRRYQTAYAHPGFHEIAPVVVPSWTPNTGQ